MKKIIDDIMAEAGAEAGKIIADARAEADKVLEAAKAECAGIEKNEADALRTELDRLIKRRASARASKQRNRMLEIKRGIMESEIEKAYRSAVSRADDGTLVKLLENRMRSGECVIYFPKDNKPSDKLKKEIERLAAEKGCAFSISYDRESVKNGFVLVYGGIEENCTFDALFAEHRSEITDAAAELLFGTEG